MSTAKENAAIDLTSLGSAHEGKWVVMSRSTRRVYAFDDKPSFRLIEQARKMGCEDPVLQKVMPFDKAFISSHS